MNLRTLEMQLFNTLIQPIYVKWGGTLGGHEINSLAGLGHGVTLNVADDNEVLLSYRLYKDDIKSFSYDCVELAIKLRGEEWDTVRFYPEYLEHFEEEVKEIMYLVSGFYSMN